MSSRLDSDEIRLASGVGAQASGASLLRRAELTGSVHSIFDGAIAQWRVDNEDEHSIVHEALGDWLLAQREGVPSEPVVAPLRRGDVMFAVRRLPFVTTRLADAAPAWSSGLAVSGRLGPVVDNLGRSTWFDLFRVVRQLRFVRSAGGPPFLSIPITQAPFALSTSKLRAGQSIRLAGGSFWFATGLVSGAPAGVYTGVRIAGGTLLLSADAIVNDDEVIVPNAVSVQVAIDLAPPQHSAAPQGCEFENTRFVAPKRLTLQIGTATAALSAEGSGGLEAWGCEVELTPRHGSAQYRPDLNRLVVPMQADVGDFRIEHVVSTDFVPFGEAGITAAGLALPAAVIAAEHLGDAEGVGAWMLELDTGLRARWRDEVMPVDLGQTILLLDGARLAFSAAKARAAGRVIRPRLSGASAPAELQCARLDKSPVHYLTDASGAESIVHVAKVEVRLFKPVDARGNCVGARLPSATVVLAGTHAGERTVLLAGLAEVRPNERPMAFGLTNALLRASPPRALVLTGRLDADGSVSEGAVFTGYTLRGLLPSLPDPYAGTARLGPRFGAGDHGLLVSIYRFGNGPESVTFVLPQNAAIDPAAVVSSDSQFNVQDSQTHAAVAAARAHVDTGGMFDFERQPRVVLLDVSSNASRFGVALRPAPDIRRTTAAQPALKPLGIDKLDLAVDGRLMVLLTLPAVQWEPVRDLAGPEDFTFANSGVPTVIDVPSVDLVPVNPLSAYRTIIDNFATANPRESRARFTLPFGMVACAELRKSGGGRGARVSEARPQAGTLEGAHQLRLDAVDPSLAPGQTPALPGATLQLPVAHSSTNGPFKSILGDSVTTTFNLYLAPDKPTALVPVTRIDLSGHGESLFSQWANPKDEETQVAKAEFQVLNGRAAYEVVQIKSVLLPYFVPVVRTITLERKGNAVFTRKDSGWVAVGDGAYAKSPGGNIEVHPGVLLRATKVTNIHETGDQFSVGTVEYVAAYFDTDLIVDGAAAPVPARRQLGYVKLSIDTLMADEYAQLIAAVGPMGSAVDSTIAVAGGRQRMRLHRVGVGACGTEFAMAAWGSLVFPGGGEWSVLEAEDTQGAPSCVTADRGLPLVRRGLAGQPTSEPYRFADPEDLLDANNPTRDYGILHAMGTQRAFFRRPRIEPASPHRIVSTERPVIADPLILATAVGPFPKQTDAIPMPSSAYALEARADGTWWLDAPTQFPAAVGRRTIRTAGTVRSDLDYTASTVVYEVDTAKPVPWRFELKDAVKIMAHTDMGDLMAIATSIDARAGAATTFIDPKLRMGGPFDIVEDLLTILSDLGIPIRPDVRMTNKWGLNVGITVPFVDHEGEDLQVPPLVPDPIVVFADTGLKIEFAVGADEDEVTTELGGTPMFAIKAVPNLYVVAIVKFKLQLSTQSGTTYGFLLGFGVAYKIKLTKAIELKGLFAITFFAVFGDTVLGYGVGFLLKVSLDISPILAIELSLEGKFARLTAQKSLPDETVFQIAKLVFAIEVSVFLVFSISLEYETKKIEIIRGPLLESDAPDVL